MIKKLLLTPFIFLINISTYAQVTLSECESKAVHFSSTISIAVAFPTECHELVEGTRNHINEDNSTDNFIEVTGYKNILITKEYSVDVDNTIVLHANRVTAGHKTKLTDIIAVDFLEDNAKIYVLNKNGTDYSVLSYLYNISGNLVPSRELKSLELLSASNLTTDHPSQKLYVISQSAAWIKIFNLQADPLGKRAENSPDMLYAISGIATGLQAPLDIKIVGSEIFVLDSDRILVFNITDSGSIAPKRTIAGANTKISGAKRLEINASNQLEVTNGNDGRLKFPLIGNGNISPL